MGSGEIDGRWVGAHADFAKVDGGFDEGGRGERGRWRWEVGWLWRLCGSVVAMTLPVIIFLLNFW